MVKTEGGREGPVAVPYGKRNRDLDGRSDVRGGYSFFFGAGFAGFFGVLQAIGSSLAAM